MVDRYSFIYWLYMLGELLTSLIISSLICQTDLRACLPDKYLANPCKNGQQDAGTMHLPPPKKKINRFELKGNTSGHKDARIQHCCPIATTETSLLRESLGEGNGN